MPGHGEELLRRLAASDDGALGAVLALPAESDCGPTGFDGALSTKIRTLVRLAALLASDASTTSIRWAAERAACAGADVDEITAVLVAVGPEVGAPQIVGCAPRLALALGFDIEFDAWDGGW